MIDSVFSLLSEAVSGSLIISVTASFFWGVLSILLSPCHLSSIPLIVGYISSKEEVNRKNSFFISLVFSIGILITIAAIGIITASLGRMMGDIGLWSNYLVAAVFFLVGLYLFGVIDLNWNTFNLTKVAYNGIITALILGLLFGLALGPCTFAYMAPVLGVIFQVSKTSLLHSALLLLAFGIGHCFVIVLAGSMTAKVQEYLKWSNNSSKIKYLKMTCGFFVILGGFYLIYQTL